MPVGSSPSSVKKLKNDPVPSNSSNSSLSSTLARGAFLVKSWSGEVHVMGVFGPR